MVLGRAIDIMSMSALAVTWRKRRQGDVMSDDEKPTRAVAPPRGESRPIYLDNHATTRVDPRVVEAMLPWMLEDYGNAASAHAFGQAARRAVETAREHLAALVGAQPEEIVFTSGATESNHLALLGIAQVAPPNRRHLVISAVEHRATLDPARRLARQGWRVTQVPPDRLGRIAPEAVAEAIGPDTALVSILAANNEVGTLAPLEPIAAVCRTRGVPFHTDAVQWIGHLPFDLGQTGADLVSLSAHKFHGPKGIGALVTRRVRRCDDQGPPPRLAPLFEGGGQERGLRAGTAPVPLIVGLGEAARLALTEGLAQAPTIRALRDRLHDRIRRGLDNQGVLLNGDPDPANRLPHNLHLSFEGIEGEGLLTRLNGVAVSAGAACSTTSAAPSHVLKAMGVEERLIRAGLRFGLSRFTTEEEIDRAADEVVRVVLSLRNG